jgi:hypothetical protein
MSGGVSIRGGAYSIAAEVADLPAFADRLLRAAAMLEETAARTAASCWHPDLVTAAVLDPVGAAEVAVNAAAAAAICAVAGSETGAIAVALREAVAIYTVADDLEGSAGPVLAAVAALPRTADELVTLHPIGQILQDNPALADVAVDALAGLPLVPGLAGDERRVLAGVSHGYTDGTPVVTARPDAASDDHSGAPRSLSDLLRALEVRNSEDDGGGMIDIRSVQHADGHTAVIVDLPGTTRWNVLPGTRTPQVTDFSTNVRALAGLTSSYERGVVQALRRAGVGADVPIMLVGHSEGGVIAAQLANRLTQDGSYHVTHVVTAGAPVGLSPIPASVSVLSLENAGDVVPELDGRTNPDRENWITAGVDRGASGITERHSLGAYREAAGDLDRSPDPSLRAWSAGASAFLNGTAVTSQVFSIRRRR